MNNNIQNDPDFTTAKAPEGKAAANKLHQNKIVRWICKLILAGCAAFFCYFAAFLLLLYLTMADIHIVLVYVGMFLPVALLFPLIFMKNKKAVLKWWGCGLMLYLLVFVINVGINAYDDSITVDTSPNINIQEYLPFEENSKIVQLDRPASLQLSGDLPTIDGAAAVFPVYSAFVHATYPDHIRLLQDGAFRYNNTVGGYHLLAQKEIEIFFGAYPSKEQIQYAAEQDTTFEYTQIGSEAFVFFVHKDNPIDSLTTEQIRGIYSGQITNWKEVGGANEPIAAYQRNQGSGSQSMLIRFMGDTPLMDPPSELVNDLMSGIIEQVSDYRSKSGSIGFSFRYYVEGIIQNPDIKLLSIDGIAPTVENIKSGSYPITTPLYAVTYAGNDNENVDLFLDWILSEEGQEIIERTGYAGVE